MHKTIVTLLCVMSMLFSLSNTMAQNVSALIYREVIENQDMSKDGDLVQIRNPHSNEVVNVKRSTRQVVGDEDGREFKRPLKVGMKWGQDDDRSDNAYCYYVEKKEDATVPAGVFKGCFKIVYVTGSDDRAWWYYPGVGVVKYTYRHHGPVINEARELIVR